LISVIQTGTVDYATGLHLQQKLIVLRTAEKIGDVLLLLEHKPIITLGRNAKATNVIASPELLTQRGVELFECDRGGDVTFHGPGQLVGYPIFDLRSHATPDGKRKTLGAVEFIRRLEEVLIRTCADFAIPTKRVPGLTGVWTNPGATTTDVGTAAPGCPVEQSSTAQDSYQGTTFSFAPALSEQSESKDATNASRLTALAAAGLCQDNTRAFGALPYDQPSELDRYQMIRTYFQMLIEEELPDAVGKMKQFASWFTHGVPGGAGLRKAIYESKSAPEILGRVEEFFEARLQPCGAGAPAKADSDLAVLR